MSHVNRATMAAFCRCFLALISVCVLEANLRATPIVYTGIVVTDVRVGRALFHNASLKITFEGDTNNILQVPAFSQECNGFGYFSYLTVGIARMEIEYQGRARTATLQQGQLFVAVDDCSGGIGFGSFTGPNGLEPAYPLGFTLGTAKYYAITDFASLLDVVSVTGSAWSCIGYPPRGFKELPETPTGNCIPPDTYPLKSDIGDIFVYQPYYESLCGGCTALASNHSGSTNRGAFLVRQKATSTLAALGAPETDSESSVLYTLQTVADGSIGNHAFFEALVTFRMISKTKSVTTQPSPVDATKLLYENRGYATVTVDDGGTIINAVFAPGEVYVRYDTGTGVAGFGSQISSTYPVALNCSNIGYPYNAYTVDCLQGEAWDYLNTINQGSFGIFQGGTLAQLSYPVDPSASVAALPQSLSQNTLLTGTAHTCAGVYLYWFFLDAYFPGDLGVCGGPAPRGLHTNRGDLFLQDSVGGALSLGNLTPPLESPTEGGWELANSGFLHVEVYRADD